mgnify:CR=1 FL=1
MKTALEKKIIITVSVLAALVLTISAAIIWPTVQKIRAMNRDTENLLRYLETKYENARNLRSSLKKARDIKEEVLGFENYIFKKGDELKLITHLENIASQNGLTEKIETSNLAIITGQKAEMSLLISGDYQKILSYLADLENSNYFININKIYITPIFDRASGALGRNVDLHISIGLYVNN